MAASWSPRGLARLSWIAEETAAEPPRDLERGQSSQGMPPGLAALERALDLYFETGRDTFGSVPLDGSSWSPFFSAVYRACRKIPPGRTFSYAQLAREAGRPRAIRAVGSAMARNRTVLVIPCHRVIRSDGALCGFSAPGGVRVKQWLLEHEAAV